MDHAARMLELLLHADQQTRIQGENLLMSLPELIERLLGEEGVLWGQGANSILIGLELLQRSRRPSPAALWAWGVASMARTGPLPWQKDGQHRRALHALRHWEAGQLPPPSLRNTYRQGLWVLRRYVREVSPHGEQPPWERALQRSEDASGLLGGFEFISDTLEDEPDSDEVPALEAELRSIGAEIRAPMAMLLVMVNLIMSGQAGDDATRWHQQALMPILRATLAPLQP